MPSANPSAPPRRLCGVSCLPRCRRDWVSAGQAARGWERAATSSEQLEVCPARMLACRSAAQVEFVSVSRLWGQQQQQQWRQPAAATAAVELRHISKLGRAENAAAPPPWQQQHGTLVVQQQAKELGMCQHACAISLEFASQTAAEPAAPACVKACSSVAERVCYNIEGKSTKVITPNSIDDNFCLNLASQVYGMVSGVAPDDHLRSQRFPRDMQFFAS